MAYRNNSFWATAELPNLMPPRVSKIVVLDVHEKQVGEACGEGSLVTLDEILDMRGFNHSCYNVYGDPMTEPSALSNCTLHIIAAIQQGRWAIVINNHIVWWEYKPLLSNFCSFLQYNNTK